MAGCHLAQRPSDDDCPKSHLSFGLCMVFALSRGPFQPQRLLLHPALVLTTFRITQRPKPRLCHHSRGPNPMGFVVMSAEQLLAGTGAVLDKPLFGVLGWPHLSTAAPGLEMFSLASLNQGLDAVLSANQAVFSHNLPPTRAGESCGGTGLTAAIGSKAQLVPGGHTHPCEQAERAATKKNKCPQLSPGLTRSQQKLFPPPVGCPCLQRGFLPLTRPLPPLAPTATQYSVEKNMSFFCFSP